MSPGQERPKAGQGTRVPLEQRSRTAAGAAPGRAVRGASAIAWLRRALQTAEGPPPCRGVGDCPGVQSVCASVRRERGTGRERLGGCSILDVNAIFSFYF